MNRFLTYKEFNYTFNLNKKSPLLEQLPYEVFSINSNITGLPYDILLDDVGIDRGVHFIPTLKVKVDNLLISIFISDNPSTVKNLDFLYKDNIYLWVKRYKNILLDHYYKKLSNLQTAPLLGPLKKNN